MAKWRCFALEPEPIPLLDAVTLHSWAKWRAYRRVPWKLAFDVVVVVLAVTLTILTVSQTSLYANGTSDTFDNVFGLGSQGATRIYNKMDLDKAVTGIVGNYYRLRNLTLSRLWHHRRSDGSVTPALLTLVHFSNGLGAWDNERYVLPSSLDTVTSQHALSLGDPLGPLRNLTLVQNAVSATISFGVVSLNVGVVGAVPYEWTMNAIFQFVTGSGLAVFRLVSEKTIADGSSLAAGQLVPAIMLVVVACMSILLSVRGLYRGYQNLQLVVAKVRSLPAAPLLPDDGKPARFVAAARVGLPLRLKLDFFELWNAWNLVGAALLVGASVMVIARSSFVGAPHFDVMFGLLLGLGTFFSCANLLRHFALSRRMSVFVNTLRLSFVRIIMFVLSCLPLFIGFVFLSVALFSQYTERFASVDLAAVSLFALMNGDDVHASFDEMTASYPYVWLSRLFMYLYVLLAVCLLLNVFIFLTEDAYHEAKVVDRRGGGQGEGEEARYTLGQLVSELERIEGATLYEVGNRSVEAKRRAARGGHAQQSDEEAVETTPLIQGEDPAHLHGSGGVREAAEHELEALLGEMKTRLQRAMESELEEVRRELFQRRRPPAL
jgi:hypothetical protein